MFFINLYIETGKVIKLTAVNADKSTALGQTLLLKESNWVMSRRLRPIPLNIIDPRY